MPSALSAKLLADQFYLQICPAQAVGLRRFPFPQVSEVQGRSAAEDCLPSSGLGPVKPVRRRSECNIPEDCSCPACKAPQPYLYRNNGKAGQLMCKVCGTLFSPDENRFSRTLSLKCPYCSHTLTRKKDRKHFIIHKCVNPKCPYYLHNLKKVDKPQEGGQS